MAKNNTTINITVNDSANNIVVGAAIIISVAGLLYNTITDNTGSAVVSLFLPNRTIATISTSASGFLTNKVIYAISPSNNTYTINLITDPSQINGQLNVTSLTNAVVAGAIVSVNGSVVGLTDSFGNIHVTTKIGDVTVQISKAGFNYFSLSGSYTTSNFPFKVLLTPIPEQSESLETPVLFSLATPTEVTSSAATPSTSTLTSVNTGASTEQAYPSEWIYPNSSDGRYLTGSQARIYIGNLFIDEIDTLYYVYNNNRIPVYGYSSKNVDAFGQGRRLVQGQITVNFVSEGYLYTVLSEYSKKNAANNLSQAEIKQQAAVNSIASLTQQQTALRTQQVGGDNSAATAAQLTSITNQILTAYSLLGSGGVASVKQVLANAATASTTSNAIVQDVPFDVIINVSGGGRTTTRKLTRCLLTSNEQVLDQSDNVIKDVYGFIGVELT